MKKMIGIAIVFPTLLFAQISIDYTQIPQTPGMQWVTNSTDTVNVNVGNSGASQSWDFSGVAVNDSALQKLIDKSSGFFSDSFPAASFVTEAMPYGQTDTTDYYYRLITDSLGTLGYVGRLDTSITKKVIRINPSMRAPLPMSYGNQWIASGQINAVIAGYPVTENLKQHNKVDGWGQVKTDGGTFDCLRVLVYDTTIMNIAGYYSDTSTAIVYEFWAQNKGPVATVRSIDKETNPNFTRGFVSFIARFSGVEENQNTKLATQNAYPNPFCGNASIKYAIPAEGKVSLKIYDISGNLIRVLVNENKKTGEYSSVWNGTDNRGTRVKTGIYFSELSTSVGTARQKLIMLK